MTTATWVLIAIIGFFLVTEHQAHLFGILPWLFLLACPVIHLFMHRGHHHRDGGHTKRSDDAHGEHMSHGGVS
jgi:hypothetical protein